MRIVLAAIVFASISFAQLAHGAPKLSLTSEAVDGENGVTGIGNLRAVAISTPDGAFLYTAGFSDALTVFARNPSTGALTFVESHQQGIGGDDGLANANALGITPDGFNVYVGGQGETIATFLRDPMTGQVAFQPPLTTWFRVSAIAFSPDSAQLYVTTDNPSDRRLGVFARNPFGPMTVLQELEDGVGGVDGLGRPDTVAVSPDGKHVYTGSDFGNSLAVFSRDSMTGLLTFVEKHDGDGISGDPGLSPDTVAVSPDGKHVYAGGSSTGLVVYSRDASTGKLTFIESHQVGFNFRNIAISSDGSLIFGSSSSGEPDVVVLLTRDAMTGHVALASLETYSSNRAVALSPDVAFGYAVTSSEAGGRVGVFRLVTATCAPTPLSTCFHPTVALKSSLTLKDRLDNNDDRAAWRWTRGDAFTLGDFGNPTTDPDDVMFCVYDSSVAPQPVLEALAPGGGRCSRNKSCWSAGTTSLKYKDSELLPDGIKTIRIKPGAAGFTSVRVSGRGSSLPTPALPLTPPVAVQVQAVATGACWEADYVAPSENDGAQFKAKGD